MRFFFFFFALFFLLANYVYVVTISFVRVLICNSYPTKRLEKYEGNLSPNLRRIPSRRESRNEEGNDSRSISRSLYRRFKQVFDPRRREIIFEIDQVELKFCDKSFSFDFHFFLPLPLAKVINQDSFSFSLFETRIEILFPGINQR